jgi:large subunit ribosomal protein L22
MAVQAVAKAKNTGISVKKLMPLADLVRGKGAAEALDILRFQPSPHAKVLAKAVKSAVANAENVHQLTPEQLTVSTVLVDPGPTLRRFRPRARGRVTRILKRSSHITVVVEGEA